ncbi:hypothetical protein [Alienimonas californiensis]|uniref:hypothetical protein n=1 Tax=Alienimonas californiensis TaxID=2527989 RepID=UPI0011A2AEB5|nr:hypothetical protein [Alienimonas californiensis]
MSHRPLFTFAPPPAAPAAVPAVWAVAGAASAEASPPTRRGIGALGRRAGARGWRAVGVVAAAGLLGLAAAPLAGSPAVAGCPCANRAAFPAPMGMSAPVADPYFAPYAAAAEFGGGMPAPVAPGWSTAAAPGWAAADDAGFQPVPKRSASKTAAPQRLARVAAAPTWRQDDGADRGPLTAPRPGNPVPPLPENGSDAADVDESTPPPTDEPTDEPMPPGPETADPSFGTPDADEPSAPRGGEDLRMEPEAIPAPEPIELGELGEPDDASVEGEAAPLSPPSLPGLGDARPNPYRTPSGGRPLHATPADPFAATGPDVIEHAPGPSHAAPQWEERSVRPLPGPVVGGAPYAGHHAPLQYGTPAFGPTHGGFAGHVDPGYGYGYGYGGGYGPVGYGDAGYGPVGYGYGDAGCGPVGCEPVGCGPVGCGPVGCGGFGFGGGLVPDSGCCGAGLGWRGGLVPDSGCCGGCGFGGCGGCGGFGPF